MNAGMIAFCLNCPRAVRDNSVFNQNKRPLQLVGAPAVTTTLDVHSCTNTHALYAHARYEAWRTQVRVQLSLLLP